MSRIRCPTKCGQEGKYIFCVHDEGKYDYRNCEIYRQLKEIERRNKGKDILDVMDNANKK